MWQIQHSEQDCVGYTQVRRPDDWEEAMNDIDILCNGKEYRTAFWYRTPARHACRFLKIKIGALIDILHVEIELGFEIVNSDIGPL